MLVGTDTYITAEEADSILNYIAFDSSVSYWLALEDVEKEYFLVQSCIEIDRLMLTGAKYNVMQKLQFPRYSQAVREYWLVPDEIKQAQAKNALALLCKSQNIPYKQGVKLHSAEAEELMRKWTNGSFSWGAGI